MTAHALFLCLQITTKKEAPTYMHSKNVFSSKINSRLLLQVTADPHTGEMKTKKKLGGAYPGQRRPNHAPYTPDGAAFDGTGNAIVHFKAYGGGNALTLVKQDGTNQPDSGVATATPAQYIQVTLPEGVQSGQTIHVQAPNGTVNAIVVPEGFGPGSTFIVEFAEQEEAPQEKTNTSTFDGSTVPLVDATVPPPSNPAADDGFASAFGRA